MNDELPSAEKEELAVIGCCLSGGLETSIEASESLTVEAFADPRLRDVFGIISRLAINGDQVNSYTVGKSWKEGHLEDLPLDILATVDLVPSPSNLPYYVSAILETRQKARVMEACHGVWTKGQNPKITSSQLITEAESVLAREDIRGVSLLNGSQASKKLVDDLERRFALQGARSGIETGFLKFDAITDGLQLGEQTVIGARPSMGKTALGLNITEHTSFDKFIPTLFVSLEMSIPAIMRRIISSQLNIPMNEIRRGTYTEEQFQRFTLFRDKAARAPIWFIDGVGGLQIERLCAAVRRCCRRNQIRLVVIDYLQKIRPSERQEKRTYEVGEVSGQLKSLAVSTNAAFLTLAQLNRESERDKGRAPRLSDLADSGQIERDADTVALIHRDRNDETGKTSLIVAKQRDGETGTVELKFNGSFCRFENPTVL